MHLTETEFVDLLEGALASSRVAHVGRCPECTAQLDHLRATVDAIEIDAADDPSPLFWNAFPSRVAAAIDKRSGSRSWLLRPAFAGVALVALLLTVAAGAALWQSARGSTDAEVTGTLRPEPVTDSGLIPEEDVEQDAAWAVVRIAADDLAYDDAAEAGISAGPGAVERAAMELSTAERAELVRLLQNEMKRSGA